VARSFPSVAGRRERKREGRGGNSSASKRLRPSLPVGCPHKGKREADEGFLRSSIFCGRLRHRGGKRGKERKGKRESRSSQDPHQLGLTNHRSRSPKKEEEEGVKTAQRGSFSLLLPVDTRRYGGGEREKKKKKKGGTQEVFSSFSGLLGLRTSVTERKGRGKRGEKRGGKLPLLFL